MYKIQNNNTEDEEGFYKNIKECKDKFIEYFKDEDIQEEVDKDKMIKNIEDYILKRFGLLLLIFLNEKELVHFKTKIYEKIKGKPERSDKYSLNSTAIKYQEYFSLDEKYIDEMIDFCTNDKNYKKFLNEFYDDGLVFKLFRYLKFENNDENIKEVEKYSLILSMIEKLGEKNKNPQSEYLKMLSEDNLKCNLKKRRGNLFFIKDGKEVTLSFEVLVMVAYSMHKTKKSFDTFVDKLIEIHRPSNKANPTPDEKVDNLKKVIQEKIEYVSSVKFDLIENIEKIKYLKKEAIRNINRLLVYKLEKEKVEIKNDKEIISILHSATSTNEFKHYVEKLFSVYEIDAYEVKLNGSKKKIFKELQEESDYIQYLKKVNLIIWKEICKSKSIEDKKILLRVTRNPDTMGEEGKNQFIGISRQDVYYATKKFYKEDENLKRDIKEYNKLSNKLFNQIKHKDKVNVNKEEYNVWFKKVYEKFKLTNEKNIWELFVYLFDSKGNEKNINYIEFEEKSFFNFLLIVIYNYIEDKDYKSSNELIETIEKNKNNRKSAVINYISKLNYALDDTEVDKFKKYIKGNSRIKTFKEIQEYNEINKEFEDLTTKKIATTRNDFINSIYFINIHYTLNKYIENINAKKEVCDYRSSLMHLKKHTINNLSNKHMKKIIKELTNKSEEKSLCKISLKEKDIDYYSKENKKNLLKLKPKKNIEIKKDY